MGATAGIKWEAEREREREREKESERERSALNSRREASAVLRAAEKLGSSIIAEKRL